jgi:putative PIN family toxin of toxin-antitoxin system
MSPLVLDTNIVLDLLVFDDPRTTALRQALDGGACQCLATPPMREELLRVLDYPKLAPWLARARLASDQVIAHWDGMVRLIEPAPKSPLRCRDPDDQKFIDLAVAHRAQLLSKDLAVLALRRRLLPLSVVAGATWPLTANVG